MVSMAWALRAGGGRLLMYATRAARAIHWHGLATRRRHARLFAPVAARRCGLRVTARTFRAATVRERCYEDRSLTVAARKGRLLLLQRAAQLAELAHDLVELLLDARRGPAAGGGAAV